MKLIVLIHANNNYFVFINFINAKADNIKFDMESNYFIQKKYSIIIYKGCKYFYICI
jgi:hypothetical protein